MKYNLDSLKKMKGRFCGCHVMNESDVLKANKFVDLIESTRSTTEPKIGNIVQYTNEYGDFYESAHIERIHGDEVIICEIPHTPFIQANKEHNGIYCTTSGGSWCNLKKKKLVYIGKMPKTFCDWGNCGPCADGAVEFSAETSVWKYADENNKFISKYGHIFTTKDYDKIYVSFNPGRKNSMYIYFSDGKAWESKEDLQAFLRTYRAEVFKGYWQNQFVAWIWKEEKHQISPSEFDFLDLPEDSFLINGNILKCKRKYDNEKHIIHTYYVWYWEVPGKDFFEVAHEQNTIREEKYTLDYLTTPEYMLARKEFDEGIAEPIKINKIEV